MSPSQQDQILCDGCGLPPEPSRKLVRCSRCKSAWYHGIDCQRRHHPEHRKGCREIARKKAVPSALGSRRQNSDEDAAFRIEQRSGRGRCTISARRLPKHYRLDGEESPLVVPVLIRSQRELRCALCFGRAQRDIFLNNGVPAHQRPLLHRFCSTRCRDEFATEGAEEEMVAFRFKRDCGESLRDLGSTALLCHRVFRIMAEKNEDVMSNMQFHLDPDNADECNFLKHGVVDVAWDLSRWCNWYDDLVKNSDGVPADPFVQNLVHRKGNSWERLASKIITNAFTICDGEGISLGFGLYSTAAGINHSCAPNLVQTFRYGSAFQGSPPKLLLTTSCKVRSGEELCIGYTDIFAPPAVRKRILLDGYKFECDCTRCDAESSVTGEDIGEGKEAFAVVQKFNQVRKVSNLSLMSPGQADETFAASNLCQLKVAYEDISKRCSPNTWYFQEAGEALVQGLLESVGAAETEHAQRECCAFALHILVTLKSAKRNGSGFNPLSDLLRGYKINKLRLFLQSDPRPALLELQQIHAELLHYYPKQSEYINDMEDCMRSGMA